MMRIKVGEKGYFQKAIDAGLCPKCKTKVDYSVDPTVCSVCKLEMTGATKDEKESRHDRRTEI